MAKQNTLNLTMITGESFYASPRNLIFFEIINIPVPCLKFCEKNVGLVVLFVGASAALVALCVVWFH